MRNLALAVGHRRRNVVGVQAHSTHAEGGARTEAADRDLQVLGLVVAVARDDARNALQCFRQIDARLRAPSYLAESIRITPQPMRLPEFPAGWEM